MFPNVKTHAHHTLPYWIDSFESMFLCILTYLLYGMPLWLYAYGRYMGYMGWLYTYGGHMGRVGSLTLFGVFLHSTAMFQSTLVCSRTDTLAC